jgi:hypothetical protein
MHIKWSSLVNEEFFDQGDRELENNMQASMFMNRKTTNIPKSQVGFISFLVRPLYLEFSKVTKEKRWLQFVETNLGMWNDIIKREDEQEKVDAANGMQAKEKDPDLHKVFQKYIKEATAKYDDAVVEGQRRMVEREEERRRKDADAARVRAQAARAEATRVLQERAASSLASAMYTYGQDQDDSTVDAAAGYGQSGESSDAV